MKQLILIILLAAGLTSHAQLYSYGMNSLGQPIINSLEYHNTAVATLTNTTTETSLIPAGTSTHTIRANTAEAGRTYHGHGVGLYSTPGVIASSITIRIKVGGTTLVSNTTTSLATGATNLQFSFDVDIKVLTVGASGTMIANGVISYTTSTGTRVVDTFTQTTTTTIDTTADRVIDVTGQWDATTTTRSATVQIEDIW